MTEGELQRAVLGLARLHGWKIAHFHDSRRQVRPGVFVGDKDAAGFPDLVLASAKRKRIMFIELKTEKGKLDAKQLSWQEELSELEMAALHNNWIENGAPFVMAEVWRPDDWLSGRIDSLLR